MKNFESLCFLYFYNKYFLDNNLNDTYLTPCDPKKPTKYITNLGSYDMSKFLQMRRSKCLDSAKFNIDKYDDNSSRGCVLEVNLEYLEELYFINCAIIIL